MLKSFFGILDCNLQEQMLYHMQAVCFNVLKWRHVRTPYKVVVPYKDIHALIRIACIIPVLIRIFIPSDSAYRLRPPSGGGVRKPPTAQQKCKECVMRDCDGVMRGYCDGVMRDIVMV